VVVVAHECTAHTRATPPPVDDSDAHGVWFCCWTGGCVLVGVCVCAQKHNTRTHTHTRHRRT
jgi:hypothetical protein